MLNNPTTPSSAGLDPDGVVRLRRAPSMPSSQIHHHVPGAQLLPGALTVEQDIVWVFPGLASSSLTPHVVREHVRESWAYTVGAVFHRAIVQHAHFGSEWVDGLRHAAQTAVDELYTIRASNIPVVEVVAGLETPIDLFGAPDRGLLRAVEWGFSAEYYLADAYGDTFRMSSTDLVRYRSRAALFGQEWALMQHRLPLLTQHYVGSAANIIELWTNEQPTYTSTFRAQAQDLSYRLASQFAER